jgi:hypothetical protein
MANSGGNGSGFSIFEEKTIPDTYADSTRFDITVYGVTLEFGQTRPASGAGHRPPHIPRVRVSMSPQHAKVVALLLMKNMKAYEAQVGRITLPQQVLEELGIAEDWDQ